MPNHIASVCHHLETGCLGELSKMQESSPVELRLERSEVEECLVCDGPCLEGEVLQACL